MNRTYVMPLRACPGLPAAGFFPADDIAQGDIFQMVTRSHGRAFIHGATSFRKLTGHEPDM